jgi:hypothetical protein
MAYNASFSIVPNADPSIIALLDTSTGSDPNITARVVNIYKSDGSLFSGPLTWPPASANFSQSLLVQDFALNIVVTVTSSSPLAPPSSYIASKIYAFNGYGNAYLYQLTQYITSNYTVVQDKDYYNNKIQLITEIDSSQNAINVGSDLSGAQSCIDRYSYLIQNAQYFF